MKKILSSFFAVIFTVGSLSIDGIAALDETEAVNGEKFGVIFEEDFEAYNDGDNLLEASNGLWVQEKSGWGTESNILSDPTGKRGGLVFAAKKLKETGCFRHSLPEGKYKVEAKMYDPGSEGKTIISALFAPRGALFNNYIGIHERAAAAGQKNYFARANSSQHRDTGIVRNEGWKTVGIDLMSSEGKIRCYADDQYLEADASDPVTDGVAIGTVWENSGEDAPDVYFDDIKVYGNIPYVQNLYPDIIGAAIKAEYKYGYDSEADPIEGATSYKWFVSDEADGEYTEVDGENGQSYMPSIDRDSSVWVKVEVTPVNSDGTISGQPTMSNSILYSGSILASLPAASDLTINTDKDEIYTDTEYTASWTFSSPVGSTESNSGVRWQYSEDGETAFTDIDNAEGVTYIPDKSLRGKYIRVCVIPRDDTGISGFEVCSAAYKVLSNKHFYEYVNSAVDVSELESLITDYATDNAECSAFRKLADFDRQSATELVMSDVPYTSDEAAWSSVRDAIKNVMQDNTENKYRVIAEDDFEGSDTVFSPTNGNVIIDTSQSLSGGYACRFYGDSKDTHQIVLDSAGQYKYVAYLYDDTSASNNVLNQTPQVAFLPKLDGTSYIAVGMNGDGRANYRYRVGGARAAWKDTSVARSTGWHKIVIDYTEGTGVKLYIDTVLVYDGSTDTANAENEWLYKTDAFDIGNFWGSLSSKNAAWIDDVCVEKKAGPYAKDIKITQTGKQFMADYSIIDPWGNADEADRVITYEWLRSDTENGEYSLISGADKSTYTIGAEDIDKWIRVRITVSDNGIEGNAQLSTAVQETYMGNTAPKVTDVSIQGTPTVSKSVTGSFNVSKNIYATDETRYTYKWLVGDTASGEYTETANVSKEYKSDVNNAGKYVKFAVRACDVEGNYSRWAESEPVRDTTTLTDVLVRISEGDIPNGEILSILNRFSETFSRLSQNQKEAVILKTLNQHCRDSAVFEKIMADVRSGNSYSGGSSGGGSSGGGSSGGGSSGGIVKPSTGGFIVNAEKLAAPVTENSEQNVNAEISDFTDLEGVPWAKTAIEELARRGIINGRSNSIFDPNASITREEFAAIMVRMFGWVPEGGSSFTDADSKAWYYPALAAAQEKKVINGISENIFGVGLAITREDMAVMAYRFLKKSGNILPNNGEGKTFDDYDDISDYAKEAIIALANGNVVNGADGMFMPRGTATRAMVAQIAYNMLDLIKE